MGLPWVEAEAIARARGLPYRTRITAPPGRPGGSGPLRVVGVRPREGLIILAYQDSPRAHPPGGEP